MQQNLLNETQTIGKIPKIGNVGEDRFRSSIFVLCIIANSLNLEKEKKILVHICQESSAGRNFKKFLGICRITPSSPKTPPTSAALGWRASSPYPAKGTAFF